MKNKATIEIFQTTRDTLLAIGKMHDSFDDVITRLIDEHNSTIGYYSEEEVEDMVSNFGALREYLRAYDDAVVYEAYKKKYVDAFCRQAV